MKIEIEVTGCRDCPMRHSVREQGFSADCCEHPDSPKKGYESALPRDGSTPDWCAARNTKQRQWVNLTDEEMFKTWLTVPAETEDRLAFGRAVEAKLKEKNNG